MFVAKAVLHIYKNINEMKDSKISYWNTYWTYKILTELQNHLDNFIGSGKFLLEPQNELNWYWYDICSFYFKITCSNISNCPITFDCLNLFFTILKWGMPVE